ncbi:hypothetical protein ASG49_13490 [Marmoricola sp. Leaf446]|uniref:DinB family protein n=1 Tax=Marmoricola sp. Leaf446 TaxID=1736379 RepID=UPI0006FC39AB|nr:DinB family protein [Marmoricola sp. Leaf446]KQT90755.1 hypothetical protein ASG49_13490 [Marmoricola sp. Leaf446]
MFPPDEHSESETLLGYLASQLEALRTSAHGLTDAQARATPTRSTLSVGGMLKHATYVLSGSAQVVEGVEITEEAQADFAGSFTLTDDETLEEVRGRFDETVAAYLERVRSIDPDAPTVEPPAPWDGVLQATPVRHRYQLVHHVEELARHAGHADILREQLDGATALSLRLAVLGLPGNDFVQPWRPEDGASGSP